METLNQKFLFFSFTIKKNILMPAGFSFFHGFSFFPESFYSLEVVFTCYNFNENRYISSKIIHDEQECGNCDRSETIIKFSKLF